MSSTISLIDLPALPLKHIFSYVGFRSLHRLRQVSKPINHSIDTGKPSIQIDDLRIKVTSKSVQIMLKSSGQNSCLEIKEHQNGAIVSPNTSKPRIQEKKSFIDCSIEALQHVLKHRKFPMGQIKLELDNKYSESKNSEFLEKFQKLLGADPLRVEEFHLEGHGHQAVQLLKLFEAKTLKTINLSRYGHYFEEISNDSLMQLEQWKNAKTLNSRRKMFNVPLQNFAHFETATVLVNKITTQGLGYLKEIYTQSLSFKEIIINFMNSDPLEKPFEGKKKVFRCSDPNFALFFSSNQMCIRFARVPIKDVPIGGFGKL
ncbi:hypothetical protein CAEBREN_09135 [Caenorhabditis brenneri]|uniref:F-box domain-containing protein n=1 Tax=Caenorhabditis brenneri TaxID=135651 RepID=G0PJV8_CAEBE|nr:hypothetical protein CAEBREN_09135 [Caenorhabditis brenneri]